MDEKQRQKDFSDINIAWSELDCITYTNTIKAEISFEVIGYFDIVIVITNIAIPVYVEAFAQILYRILDSSIADTMALKHFYMRNLYCKDMSIED
ncbi:1116_t:CDS:2 [Funneliformis geosporum]|nr:1116_t:CDS:2 [Funneliformis geosporum]